MAERDRAVLAGGVTVELTDRRLGDVRLLVAERLAGDDRRCRSVVDRDWHFATQVHGAEVVVLDEHDPRHCPHERVAADALVSSSPFVALAVLGADCPLIGLASAEGVFGAVHAGWRGLEAGVLGNAAAAMRRLGARTLEAVVSPYICASCYEFHEPELSRMTARFGEGVVALDRAGNSALDLSAALAAALAEADVRLVGSLGACTCDERFYSARTRQDLGRHALVVSSAR